MLKVAGTFLRAEKDREIAPEAGLLMRALRDFNLPKIAGDDLVVFMGLLKDLFPDVFSKMPKARDQEFEQLIKDVAIENKLQPADYFVQNVVDMQDLLAIRHCVFAIGVSCVAGARSARTHIHAYTRTYTHVRTRDTHTRHATRTRDTRHAHATRDTRHAHTRHACSHAHTRMQHARSIHDRGYGSLATRTTLHWAMVDGLACIRMGLHLYTQLVVCPTLRASPLPCCCPAVQRQ